VQRGFERLARDVHAALAPRPELEVRLLSGARVVRREGRVAAALGRALRRDGYFTEQVAYAARLVPQLAAWRPDVVFVSDWVTAGALGRARAVTGLRYRILLSNSAPGMPPYDWSIDHVQQVTPQLYRWALEYGDPPERHTMLPMGVAVPVDPPGEVDLGLPGDRKLVLSVAALNATHKRLDYVIREVASLDPRPFLVMIGQPDGETPEILRLANELLGADGFVARSVAPDEVAAYYAACDLLVHGTQYEGTGLVLLEALARGMTVIANDEEWSRFVTGGHAVLADLIRRGELARLIESAAPGTDEERAARVRHVRDGFGWDALAPRYVDMLRHAASLHSRRWRQRT
jgi:glycosyltransferase involved in cell wall biosynthesis